MTSPSLSVWLRSIRVLALAQDDDDDDDDYDDDDDDD